jgi:hypothetical protein
MEINGFTITPDSVIIAKTVDSACPILVIAKDDRDVTDDAFVVILD